MRARSAEARRQTTRRVLQGRTTQLYAAEPGLVSPGHKSSRRHTSTTQHTLDGVLTLQSRIQAVNVLVQAHTPR